jgi:hypothetical protein
MDEDEDCRTLADRAGDLAQTLLTLIDQQEDDPNVIFAALAELVAWAIHEYSDDYVQMIMDFNTGLRTFLNTKYKAPPPSAADQGD